MTDSPQPEVRPVPTPEVEVSDKLPKHVIFVLTEDCNFRCSYCYLPHKSSRRMTLGIARAAIDYLLTRRDLFPERHVGWDFIGGEPLLEAELIDQIVTYVRLRTYELEHPWFVHSEFSISTNGSLYGTPAVQRLITRHPHGLAVSITIDGPEHVHDLRRRTADGSGTYQRVVANVPLWLSQFPRASTKMTVDHENLQFVAESVLHLFELGIKEIHSNVVFEDVWEPGDDEVLEQQLDHLGDAIVMRGLWRTHTCSFFNRNIGVPLDPIRDNGNWCGAGKMLAVGTDGTFYPCNRFLAFALCKRQPRSVGDVRQGLDLNRVRPFLALTRTAQSPQACIDCSVARGCAWCQGLNYDDAETPTIYQRAVHLCAMHKARVRANRRFWDKIDAMTGDQKS